MPAYNQNYFVEHKLFCASIAVSIAVSKYCSIAINQFKQFFAMTVHDIKLFRIFY